MLVNLHSKSIIMLVALASIALASIATPVPQAKHGPLISVSELLGMAPAHISAELTKRGSVQCINTSSIFEISPTSHASADTVCFGHG
jgi:hypothetical protein